jgi:hypothetical protein
MPKKSANDQLDNLNLLAFMQETPKQEPVKWNSPEEEEEFWASFIFIPKVPRA